MSKMGNALAKSLKTPRTPKAITKPPTETSPLMKREKNDEKVNKLMSLSRLQLS